MIKLDHITKTYSNEVRAVNDFSMEVGDGEIVGFIGPNGAGKTTSIKMMTGILKPDSGKVMINDFDMQDNPLEAKKIIGYISDSPDMFLRLTGIEFINFMADIYDVPEEGRREKIESLASRFDLMDALDKQMQGYSHGMRQKMMVIACLVHEPLVWILDEPLTGLDPKSAFVLKNMMREHADKGNSVLFSTHVLEVAEKLCDRIVVINHGEALFTGTLEELTEKYPGMDLEKIFLEMTGADLEAETSGN